MYTTNAGIHRLLHDFPRFFIFFIVQFLIFNQMFSIRAFGRRKLGNALITKVIGGQSLYVVYLPHLAPRAQKLNGELILQTIIFVA